MDLTLSTAFALGFSTSVGICLFSCLPVYLPLIIGHSTSAIKGLILTMWFVLGRFSGYLSLGIVAAIAGNAFNDVFNEIVYPKATATIIFVFGLLILFHGTIIIAKGKPKSVGDKKCTNYLRKTKSARHPAFASFMLGLVSTMSYCLSVALYLLLPFALGHYGDALLATAAFGLGANVVFIAIAIPLAFGMDWLSKHYMNLVNPLRVGTGALLMVLGVCYMLWAIGPVYLGTPTNNYVLPTMQDLGCLFSYLVHSPFEYCLVPTQAGL